MNVIFQDVQVAQGGTTCPEGTTKRGQAHSQHTSPQVYELCLKMAHEIWFWMELSHFPIWCLCMDL